jgi:hypothetical protein
VQGNLGDVNVFVDGVLKGFTQSDGKLLLPVDEGTHSLRFTKTGYEDYQVPGIAISANKEASVPFNLNPNVGVAPPPSTDAYLTIHSAPGGALVSIDKAQAGRTDAQGNLIVPVKPGKRAVQIGLDNFQTFNQSVNVKAGEKKSLAAALTAVPKPTPVPSSASAPAATPPQPVQILSFSAAASRIEQGQSTTLKWDTANASDVTIDNGLDAQASSGHISVSPSTDTTYTLTAKGTGGTLQKSVRVTVEPKKVEVQPSAPPPSTPSSTPIRPVDETALLQEVVSRFESAYNAHDIARMKSAWTGMNAQQSKGFQNFFKGNPEATVNDNCTHSSLTISGDTAQWACTETTTVKSGGKLQGSSRPIRFSFVKNSGSWSISDRQ